MIDPNREISDIVLQRLRDASYERFHTQMMQSIEQLLGLFEMTWDDLAKGLAWELERGLELKQNGDALKRYVGEDDITLEELNAIAHIFSTEPYIIFRPRFPYTKT